MACVEILISADEGNHFLSFFVLGLQMGLQMGLQNAQKKHVYEYTRVQISG